MNYKFIINYRTEEIYRKSFNELTNATYGFDFEDWYQQGFWGENYIPYSLVDNGKIIANASVNIMDFTIDGIEKHYVQIGTVMTHEDYRNQGLSRYLIERILSEWSERADGIYLFANDTVLDFYPKFGFVKSKEFQYRLKNPKKAITSTFTKVNMSDSESVRKFLSMVKPEFQKGRITLDNDGLFMFYCGGFLNDCIYYSEAEKTYAIVEQDDETVILHQIFCEENIDYENIAYQFTDMGNELMVGFPLDSLSGFEEEIRDDDDDTLFILREDLELIEKKKLLFPSLSHA